MTLDATTKTNKNGNKLTQTFVQNGDRYLFDFNLCKSEDGWKSMETPSDAPYFGVWVHPGRLETMQYVEGDVYHTVCTDAASYTKEIDDMIECYGVAPAFVTIDPENKTATNYYEGRENYLPIPKP